MIPLLAQAAALPSPEHYSSLGWLLVALAALSLMLKNGLDLWKDHFREEPRPSGTYVTISDFKDRIQELSEEMATDRAENKREHENLFSKLGGQERGINTNLRELDRKVAALDERSLTTNSTLAVMGQTIERIRERLKA
jgi:hypothetical protein